MTIAPSAARAARAAADGGDVAVEGGAQEGAIVVGRDPRHQAGADLAGAEVLGRRVDLAIAVDEGARHPAAHDRDRAARIGGDQGRGGGGGQLGRAGVGVDVKEVDQVGRQRASELGRVVIVVGGLGRAVGDLDQEVEVGAGGGAAVDRDLDDVGDGRRQGHGATLPRSRPPRAHRAVDRVT
jgi:hypothetical protein